jgi:hypothetical protein
MAVCACACLCVPRAERIVEPYAPPRAAELVCRSEHSAPLAGAPRFSAQVPSDRLVPLAPGSPRLTQPPISQFRGTSALSAGLTDTGIYGPAFTLDLNRASGQSQRRQLPLVAPAAEEQQPAGKTYWKTLTSLAHRPTGTQRDADTAQQLFHTYRKHLAF